METSDWIILASVLLSASALLWRITRVEVGIRERLARLEVGQQIGQQNLSDRIDRMGARLEGRIDRLEDRMNPRHAAVAPEPELQPA